MVQGRNGTKASPLRGSARMRAGRPAHPEIRRGIDAALCSNRHSITAGRGGRHPVFLLLTGIDPAAALLRLAATPFVRESLRLGAG